MMKVLNKFFFYVGFPLWILVTTLAWVLCHAIGDPNTWMNFYLFLKEDVMQVR